MTDYEKLISVFENNRNVLIVNRHEDYFEVICNNGSNSVCFLFFEDGKLDTMYS